MVSIQLDSRTTLTSDSRQWVLNIDGRSSAFHSTLTSAIIGYYEAKLRSSDAKTIDTLLLRQKQIVTALNSALTPLQIKVEAFKQ